MVDIPLEMMSATEAARWFRRSRSWLCRQTDLLCLRAGDGGPPLYHVRICRAYVLGILRDLRGESIHRLQLAALEAACGLRLACRSRARRRRSTRSALSNRKSGAQNPCGSAFRANFESKPEMPHRPHAESGSLVRESDRKS